MCSVCSSAVAVTPRQGCLRESGLCEHMPELECAWTMSIYDHEHMYKGA